MHPAWSVIVFTTLSGAGYGLIFALAWWAAAYPPPVLVGGIVFSLVLITAGLCASTLHLANPKNAWRAVSRLRTSWLSREAALALVFYPLALLWLALVFNGTQSYGYGLVVGFAALLIIYCTAMIYACVRSIPAWNNRLTPVSYLALGLAVGAMTACALGSYNSLPRSLWWFSVAMVSISAIIKALYFIYVGSPKGPGIADATGLTGGTVRLLDVGHTAGNFLTREFGYQLEPRTSKALRMLFFGLVAVLPLGVLFLGEHPGWMWAGALAVFTGTLVERWLFFAEARHVVNLYHGSRSL